MSKKILSINGQFLVINDSLIAMPDMNLQDKTVTPRQNAQVVVADAEFTGLNKVTVEAMPIGELGDPTISEEGVITASVATSGYIASEVSKTLELPTQGEKTVVPTTSEQTIVSTGVYTTGEIKVAAMPMAEQATPVIEVDDSGLITTSTIQDEGYVVAGTKSATKQLLTQEAQTIMPGATDKTIEAGKYLIGIQTIKGDANLIPENIAKDAVIFGITGIHQGGEDVSAELTEQDVLISEISLALDEAAIAGDEAFAAIGVTYPEGSTCTCSNGTKTLTAKDTSGQALFLFSEAGTWQIRCFDGSDFENSENKASETVEITTEGQGKSIELSYDFIIYSDYSGTWKNGYELISIGSCTGTNTIINDANPPFIGGTEKCGGRLNNVVDVSKYSQLVIDCSYTGNQWYSGGLIPPEGAWRETNWINSPGTDGMVASFKGASSFERSIQTLDVSGLSGDHVFKINYYTDPDSRFYIYDMRLKK